MSKTTGKKGILEKLASGPVLGDGGFCFGLEKRGYVKAGPWTPECVCEHPDAVKQYHREFLRAGADVMQAYTFYATDSKLDFTKQTTGKPLEPTAGDLNLAACRIAREVANEGDALVSVSLSETPVYRATKDKKAVQAEFKKQIDFFVQCDIDFVICEYFAFVEEMEWAIEIAKESKLPVAATMCIGPISDLAGVPTGECGVRLAKAGADIVGINCNFGPYVCLEAVKKMKKALDEAELKPYLMVQPLAYRTPEINSKEGYLRLPETPFALETRTVTRFEAAKWARDALEAGVNYIGGCCGFEPYHIRAMSEELSKERGKVCQVTEEKGFLTSGLMGSTKKWLNARNSVEYWKELEPTTGRPHSAALAKPDMDD